MPSAAIIDPFVNDYQRSSLLIPSFNNDYSLQFQQQTADALGKKSQNMTECVPVPSSEHVAEIVGRQGCKIKALRAKTNTYIKTPVRGDEPVFIITGRKEDVQIAKKEIISAAEHFSQIRAGKTKTNFQMKKKNKYFLLARKQQNSTSSSSNSSTSSGSNTNLHINNLILPSQQTTIQVRVPYRVVGLVVGPKGATIKRIQQTTNTYIITPGRDKEPVFEIAGLPENVEAARIEIESHIAARTGQASSSGNQSPVEDNDDTKWMKTKFTHHSSLPFNNNTIDDNDNNNNNNKHIPLRTVSQSSYFPLEDNSLMNQSFDFGSSFDLINEQTSDNNNNTIFDSVWSNFSLLSLKTS
jgi:RNA-binding protein MEX3